MAISADELIDKARDQRRREHLRCICLVGMLLLCPAVNATPVLDINLTPGVDPRAINGGSQFYLFEQTYTAGIAGHLTSIEFWRGRLCGAWAGDILFVN